MIQISTTLASPLLKRCNFGGEYMMKPIPPSLNIPKNKKPREMATERFPLGAPKCTELPLVNRPKVLGSFHFQQLETFNNFLVDGEFYLALFGYIYTPFPSISAVDVFMVREPMTGKWFAKCPRLRVRLVFFSRREVVFQVPNPVRHW